MAVVCALTRLAIVVLCWSNLAAGDLQQEMYAAAVESAEMTKLEFVDIDGFIESRRSAGPVAIMFHQRACNICHTALPELERALNRLRKQGDVISVGHVEASSRGGELKTRFGLRGFPAISVFRKPVAEVNEMDTQESLVGARMVVSRDGQRILRASRMAKISEEKDPKRLKCAGLSGEVLDIDIVDATAQLRIQNVGKVWLPLEVLRPERDIPVSHHRANAGFLYSGAWDANEMESFLKRVDSPFLTPIDASDWSEARNLLSKENYPALIFCGDEQQVPPALVDAAITKQGKSRAFVLSNSKSCPFGRNQSSVAIYSPPSQQWSPKAVRTQGAVAIASPSIASNYDALANWIKDNYWPGIIEVTTENFHFVVNSGKKFLLVAVRGSRDSSEETILVQNKLQQVAAPVEVDLQTRLFSYGEESFFYGVVDGSVDGLDRFGVYPDMLPRIVMFEGPGIWVEDVVELTVESLPTDLAKIPALWRSTSGVKGSLVWFAKLFFASYWYYHTLCVTYFGPQPGPLVMPVLFSCTILVVVYQLLSIFKLLFNSLQDCGEGDKKNQ